MRVISGKYGGRKLVEFTASHVRPTTDRVKETLFNKLQWVFDQPTRVLDLFSGTGALAIECLSRGAVGVDLIEKHAKSLSIIRANFERLKITESYQIFPMDAFKYIRSFEGVPYDLVLADPPFTHVSSGAVLESISESSSTLLTKDAVIVIEAQVQEKLKDIYGDLKVTDRRDFGDKSLYFFAHQK